MKEKDILYVQEELTKLLNITKEQYGELEKLIKLESEGKRDSSKYDKILKHYIDLENSTELTIDRIKNNIEHLKFLDLILTGMKSEIKGGLFLPENEKELNILRLYRKITTLNSNLTETDPTTKMSNILSLASTYDLNNSNIYYLDEYIDRITNEELKAELIEMKYKVVFVNYLVEKTMLELKFKRPENVVLVTNYYIEGLRLPSRLSLEIDSDSSLFIANLYIKTITDIPKNKLNEIEAQRMIYSVLSLLKSISIRLTTKDLENLKNKLKNHPSSVAPILTEALDEAINDKAKIYKLKRVPF